MSLYYALTSSALVVSLHEGVLERALDRLIDQPVQSDQKSMEASSQFLLDLAAEPGSALSTLAALAFTDRALTTREATRAVAGAVLLADPPTAADAARVRALMRRTFGSVVLTPEGREYVHSAEGPRDPLRGTVHAPVWPELPVAGSPLSRLLTRLKRARSELAFEDEPRLPGSAPLQSLRAKVSVELEPQRASSSSIAGASAPEKTR
jgi:hypothetical protein